MTPIARLTPRPAQLTACTISRDLSRFDQLVDGMEAELGDRWGDVTLGDAARFLGGAAGLRFVVLALIAGDEDDPAVAGAMAAARAKGLRVMLVVHGMGPAALQKILRLGPDDVLPYPLPHGALREAARRGDRTALDHDLLGMTRRTARKGIVIPVIGVAGGVGATTLAIGLAWELGQRNRVCLIDMDAQSGAVAAYLNLGTAQPTAFPHGMRNWRGRFEVLIAARPEDVGRLIETVRAEFDVVIVDLPTGDADLASALVGVGDTALAVMEPDARSIRNAMRLMRDLNHPSRAKLRFVVNRAPGVIDMTGRARLRRLGEGLAIAARLPDGGQAVADAAERGLPLAETAPRNGFRRSLSALAAALPLKR